MLVSRKGWARRTATNATASPVRAFPALDGLVKFLPVVQMRRWALLLSLALPVSAWGACSRPINIPTSALGAFVTVNGQDVGGLIPDLLRKRGAELGCEFRFTVVPRARAEMMFARGESDALLTATQTRARDKVGAFIHLFDVRATLISLASDRPSVRSLHELLARRELHVALVRGFDYGPHYQELVEKLAAEKRLDLESSPAKVARLINEGMADVTIMLPIVMAGAIAGDPRLAGMSAKLCIEPMDELQWGQAGSYVSRISLTAEDRDTLLQLFAEVSRSKAISEAYRNAYPARMLEGSVRPN